ncbi:MAG: hypothetical protein CM15mV58_140 [uncultured marine virus]|nr:MAG: hypothetical protein CM15mV58_140 [uncultured marine virus]
MDLTSLAEEKYPEPKEIKIKQDSFDFKIEEDNKAELALDPCYKFQLFNIIKELKSQQK